MSARIIFVSNPIHSRINRGAYERPFSGVGIEYDPLGVKPGRTGITLHEAGFLPGNSQWNFPAVFSPFWRFYYNGMRGHSMLFGERIVELTPAHFAIIPPHSFFHCLGDKAVPTFWLAFSFTRKVALDQAVPMLLKPRDTELCLIRDLKELILANPYWEPTDAIYRNSLALLQVVLSRPEWHWQPPVPSNFERVRLYIEANLGTRLSASLLARQAGLSIAGFNRGFRRHFGATPASYVTQMRIREAARLLLKTDATIDFIAEQTGFPNRAYFSRVFKRVIDEAPAGFRRRHARQEQIET
jgi:AraC family transcriptional regulator, arabinose operon regulatory protein